MRKDPRISKSRTTGELAPVDHARLDELKKLFKGKRNEFLANNGEDIIALEKKYMSLFIGLILNNANQLRRDFDLSSQLRPFWANSQPQQRGRSPKGDSVPYIEVGETSLTANITNLVSESKEFGGVRFPGLPAGGDMRFVTNDAFIHLDIKVTGPRDELDKIVLPPHQFSGDGANWSSEGVSNSTVTIYGYRSSRSPFRPGLPPFYIIDDQILICLVYVLKTVYLVNAASKTQPLRYLELICVPNGLLLFAGPKYQRNHPGLLSAGKDDKSTPIERARRRVYLNVLSEFASWRCVMFRPNENDADSWSATERSRSLQ